MSVSILSQCTQQVNDNQDDQSLIEEDSANVENMVSDRSCARTCKASNAKRFIIYKRDWCGILCHIFIPLIFVVFGLWLTTGPSKLTQSPPRFLSTDWYPAKQRIIMNRTPVNNTDHSFTGEQIFANFPNST